jgi:uncharacterized membrane protein YebE (DUF533 family)
MVAAVGGRALALATQAGAWQGVDRSQSASVLHESSLSRGSGNRHAKRTVAALAAGGAVLALVAGKGAAVAVDGRLGAGASIAGSDVLAAVAGVVGCPTGTRAEPHAPSRTAAPSRLAPRTAARRIRTGPRAWC